MKAQPTVLVCVTPQEASRQLVEAGVDEHSIYVSGICTFNNCADYFSARRLGINSGRIFSGIMLR